MTQHHDSYDEVEDFLDTFLEEGDTEFQRSLQQGARDFQKGQYLTHAQLKLALADRNSEPRP